MSLSLASRVDIDLVKPYIDQACYMEFDSANPAAISNATDEVRDNILKPAAAELITEATSDREGFPGASPALVETFFENAVMQMVVGGELPPKEAANRTEAALDKISEIMVEMIDMTSILDAPIEQEQETAFKM